LFLIKQLFIPILGIIGLIIALKLPLFFTEGVDVFIKTVFIWIFFVFSIITFSVIILYFLVKYSKIAGELIYRYDFIFLPNIFRYRMFKMIYYLLFIMYKSGLPYSKIFVTLTKTAPNKYAENELNTFEIIAKRDETLARILRVNLFFKTYETQVITAAETAGALEPEFKRLYDEYSTKYNENVKLFFKIIGKTIYIIITFIVLAVLFKKLTGYFEIVGSLLN